MYFLLGGSKNPIPTTAESHGLTQTNETLDRLDTAFVFIFAAELAVNLFARWFWPFIRNRWCMFDLVIVSVSLISLAPLALPFDLLLLFRCCRVLRVLGRFKSVRSIFNILFRSLIPMGSAFFIIFLISSICAYAPPPPSASNSPLPLPSH